MKESLNCDVQQFHQLNEQLQCHHMSLANIQYDGAEE